MDISSEALCQDINPLKIWSISLDLLHHFLWHLHLIDLSLNPLLLKQLPLTSDHLELIQQLESELTLDLISESWVLRDLN